MHTGRNNHAFPAIALTLLLGACASAGPRTASTAETAVPAGENAAAVTPQRFAELVAGDDYLVVNVHIPYAGDIPGTDLSIPFNEIESNLASLPADKDAPIALYCRSGPMSVRAAATLHSLGYTNLSLLTGGMHAWEDAGFTLEREPDSAHR